jgi:pyruvate dehydrogenase E2 component (dihydrolipoamide acetyltransferase)
MAEWSDDRILSALTGKRFTMSIELKMPALSPTMEEGTLAKWLVKEGDVVKSGDLLAEIETDKATMEFESIDEGIIQSILIAEGAAGVKVGTVIAVLSSDEGPAPPIPSKLATKVAAPPTAPKAIGAAPLSVEKSPRVPRVENPDKRIIASPLAKRLAAANSIDLADVAGSGPNGRIVKADLDGVERKAPVTTPTAPQTPDLSPPTVPMAAIPDFGIPFEDAKLSGMRKTIAKRLTQSMQDAPHIYLTVDVRLDALLKLRSELNDVLSARGVKLSVNDMLIKALALALMQVPQCNVAFAGDVLRKYSRADVSVAVSIAGGLITPIVTDAAGKSLATIATEMNDLAERAKAGKLAPQEYQGGTASLSNMGMMGIKQFTAVINPPQAMILAVGAGEKRPYIVDDALGVATVMSCTGSFDHRAIDGADGAILMQAFKELVESPLGLLV